MNDNNDIPPWVQLTFVDVFGTSCSMLLPASRWDEAVERGVPFDGSALEGRARLVEADMRLQPEPDSLLRIDATRGRAICNVVTSDGDPWTGDPRTTLLQISDDLERLFDTLEVSAELEFYILDRDARPADTGGYFDDVGAVGMQVVQVAATALQGLGVEVVGCHHEAGDGQYEIDFEPMAPVDLADAIVIAKHQVRAAAVERDLLTTFMALPLVDQPGSGLHVHQRSPRLIDADTGKLTEDGRSFSAGQLAHARGLSALAAPNVNSYRRLHGGAEAPSAAVWGHHNRAALIRVSSVADAASIEYRGADPAANPYLLIAGLLTAGAAGIDASAQLPAPNDEVPGTFEPGGAIRLAPLPRTLDEALDALEADDALVDALDRGLVDILTTGRRAELVEYRASVTHWELDRYLREA